MAAWLDAVASLFTAKGDLLGTSDGNAVAPLPVGSNGQVLTADSTSSLGFKWAAAAGSSALVGAYAYKNNVAQSVANVTSAVLSMESEVFDTNAFHSTVTNPSRITIPAGLGGTYLVGASAILSNSAANQSIVSGIFKNGVDLPGIPNQRLHTSLTGITVAVASSTVAVLAAGDYLEAYVYHTMGGARDVSYATLWAIKIG